VNGTIAPWSKESSKVPRLAAWLCTATALGLPAGAASDDAVNRVGVAFEEIDDPLAPPAEFLHVDEAFVFTPRLEEGKVVGRWQMPDGYYLYRHHFVIDAGDVELGELNAPPGVTRFDDYFGESEVYFGNVEVSAGIASPAPGPVIVRFGYQGCAEKGYCYPPTVRTATFELAPARVSPMDPVPTWAWLAGLILVLGAVWGVLAFRR